MTRQCSSRGGFCPKPGCERENIAALESQIKKDTTLFCDLKTDEEKSAFFLSGRGYETGVIAQSIQNDVAMAYHRCAEYAKEVQALRDALQEVVDAADGEGWDQLDPGMEKQRAALAAMEKQKCLTRNGAEPLSNALTRPANGGVMKQK